MDNLAVWNVNFWLIVSCRLSFEPPLRQILTYISHSDKVSIINFTCISLILLLYERKCTTFKLHIYFHPSSSCYKRCRKLHDAFCLTCDVRAECWCGEFLFLSNRNCSRRRHSGRNVSTRSMIWLTDSSRNTAATTLARWRTLSHWWTPGGSSSRRGQ